MAKIAVLLTQGFADWEYAMIAGTGGPYYGLEVQFFTPKPGQVTSMGGLVALVGQDLNALADWSPNAVAVIGGTIWESDKAPDISALLVAQNARGAVVGGICAGTLALARAGLLGARAHTSNDAAFLSRNVPGYAGAQGYVDTPGAVVADRVISAAGAAPVSFAAALFEAVGVAQDQVAGLRAMLSAEHH